MQPSYSLCMSIIFILLGSYIVFVYPATAENFSMRMLALALVIAGVFLGVYSVNGDHPHPPPPPPYMTRRVRRMRDENVKDDE